ncbi:hypothetical protein [Acidipila sp. EB88]|uniref:hypothetical protein n=1 Tax=Acidipila sp. EB88 TaxID=2305226 RepID=UPI000F5F5D4F|nr:hypothetical protein [Acidipila sp. EB88]RRA49297.1 hypothetical protein D1Y84_14455 [Acidipila sp. EB88]
MRIGDALGVLTRWAIGFAFAFLLATGAAQQKTTAPLPSDPVPMPPDLAADSYEIYSELLPGREIEWGDAPRSFWLLEETTKAQPLDTPCATSGGMNPHEAIQPPQAQQAEFAEVLADFDRRCHERYGLDASKFHLKLPVRLLDEKGQERYTKRVSGFVPPRDTVMQAPPTPQEFDGAAGMHSFTAVYFNKAHTLAMTQIGMYCGGLCGNWTWVVLARMNGLWQPLPWAMMSGVS